MYTVGDYKNENRFTERDVNKQKGYIYQYGWFF
jgi:hypothetical protein